MFQRNPNIRLYGLPWTFPGWVGGKTANPYSNPYLTADYVVRWVLGAKKYYGLNIDYVGVSVGTFIHLHLRPFTCMSHSDTQYALIKMAVRGILCW